MIQGWGVIMDKDTRKHIEQALLTEIDQLIECGIDASQADDDQREEILAEGQEMVQRILGLLTQIFFGPGEYYETILKQLVGQKLPNSHVLASFGDFSDVLEELIAAGIAKYTAGQAAGPDREKTAVEESESSPAQDDESEQSADPEMIGDEPAGAPAQSDLEAVAEPKFLPQPEQTPTGLRRSLRLLFPRSRVLNDFILNGLVLSHFLPDHNLAFEVAGLDSLDNDRRKLHICQQNGISLVRISPEDAGEHKRIQREIRRQARSAKK